MAIPVNGHWSTCYRNATKLVSLSLTTGDSGRVTKFVQSRAGYICLSVLIVLGHSVKCLFSIQNYRVKDTFYRVSQENRNQNFVDTHARTMPSVFSRPGDAAAKRTMTNPQLGGVKSL